MKNNKEEILLLFDKLKAKKLNYFYIDNLSNQSLQSNNFNQKKSFYDTYFEQTRKNYPFKILQVSVVSYIGGCFFGLLMLAFQSFGAMHTFTMNLEEKKVYYENFKHFKTEMRKLLINSAHRNGIFVIRLTLSIGAFNALINYLPLPHPKFTELYGFGNLDTLLYFLFPSIVFFKCPNTPLSRKLKILLFSTSTYTIFKMLYVNENYYKLKKRYDEYSKRK